MTRLLAFAVLSWIVVAVAGGSTATAREFIGVYDGQLYLIHSPSDRQPPEAGWPILLFFHGYGERGHSLPKLRFANTPAGVYDEMPDLHENFVLITPQLPRSERFWDPVWVRGLVKDALRYWDVDWSRLSVTGLSIGGTGVWDYVTTYPEEVYSAVSFSGVARESIVDPNSRPFEFDYEAPLLSNAQRLSHALANIPFVEFHCEEDVFVPFRAASRMVGALKRIGNKSADIVPVPGCRHGAWVQYYSGQQDMPRQKGTSVYEWLLSPSSLAGRG